MSKKEGHEIEASALLPIFQGALTDTDKEREAGLGQTGFFPDSFDLGIGVFKLPSRLLFALDDGVHLLNTAPCIDAIGWF